MTGIIDRIGALAGTEWAHATNFAHSHFQERLGVHRHTGRAFIETVAEVCRNHPNLVGLAAGVMVERLLVEEKKRHDAGHPLEGGAAPGPGGETLALPFGADAAPAQPGAAAPTHHAFDLKIFPQSPSKVALEVFGALLLLKLAAGAAHLFHRRNRPEVWFAPAAKIHLFSGALATYFTVAAIKSPRLSAWRNGAILFFGTDAIKPLVRPPPRRRVRRA